MKKIFISDLHLGDGSKSDDFRRDEELVTLFEKYIDEEVYILGDIYELWQARLDKIIWSHPKIYDWLNHYLITSIYGNHDFLPFSKVWNEHYENSLIYAEHGHQHDIYNNTSMFNLKWPIGKYITLGVGWLEKLWHKDADEYLLKKYGEFKYTAAKLQGATKTTKSTNPVDEWLLGGKRQKIYIAGHTHKANLIKDCGEIYANCGAWVDSVEPTYIEVEENKKQNVVVVRLRHGITYEIIKEEVL